MEDLTLNETEKPFYLNQQSEELLKKNLSNQDYENIQTIFQKNQALKHDADIKHEEIQKRFKELKERLTFNTNYLQKLKKSIDDVQFNYQRKLLENQESIKPSDFFDPEKNSLQNKFDMVERIKQIQFRLDNLRKQKSKEKEEIPNNFKEAFDNVSRTFDNIQTGAYSSNK